MTIKTYKCISIKKPYIDELYAKTKRYEMRNFRVSYRGLLVLCSSKVPAYKHLLHELNGFALYICDLVDIVTIRHTCYRFGWVLKDINKIKPIPVTGQLNLYSRDLSIVIQ